MFSATKSFFTNEAAPGGGPTPSWTLDFSTGTPSGYTLTRASTGTYVDSSGYVASASTDIARLTHNSSGSRLGLLVEGQRTNQAVQSATLPTTNYTYTNTTRSANATAAPNNVTEATRVVEQAGTAAHLARTTASITAADICVSIFAKADQRSHIAVRHWVATNNWIQATFDLSAGTAGAVQAGSSSGFSSTQSGIENYGNGWYRCWVRGAKTSASTFFGFDLCTTASPTLNANGEESYAGNTANGLFIWGAQIEPNNTAPSSYIPTTTASVTRSADLVHVLDSTITGWQDPGALVVHFYPPGQAGTLISTDDASTAQVGIEASTTTAARAFWSSGSTATGTIGTGVQKAVHYWNGSSSKFCINGGTVESGSNNLTIANTDFVTLGAEATESGGVPGTFSQYANCVIRKVEFYSGTLTDANLQTITT